jgi:hypothetical protein
MRQGDSGSTWWRHGYLLETGFEIADTFSLLVGLYPYRMEGVKAEMKPAVVFHHLCGTLLAFPILTTGLYVNSHLQAIAMWMLLGASASCFTVVYLYGIDPERNIARATAVNIFNCMYFLFCRFGMFPYHSFHLLNDVKSGRLATGDMEAGTILRWLHAGFACMFLFNLAIAADVIPKTARYIRRALDGVTALETAPVPRSRDSVHSKRRSVIAHYARSAATRRSSRLAPLQLAVKSIVDAAAATCSEAMLLDDHDFKME